MTCGLIININAKVILLKSVLHAKMCEVVLCSVKALSSFLVINDLVGTAKIETSFIGLGAFVASELDKVFSGYQPR
jgi:hypothetical protein